MVKKSNNSKTSNVDFTPQFPNFSLKKPYGNIKTTKKINIEEETLKDKNDIYSDLDINVSNTNTNNKDKVIYYDKNVKFEENENEITTSDNAKLSFPEILEKFDINSNLNEKNITKFKKNLKGFLKNKDKEKVNITFDDTKMKVAERTLNYDNVVGDVTQFQEKVKVNREADILDFTVKHNISTTGKSLISHTTELNPLEKNIKNLLVNNKYDTDDKILERETKTLMTVNPKELMRRYGEMQKLKSLLYSQEIKNKRKNKIKSKLYHKIQKKQKNREEELLLDQLREVDPEGVKKYLDKKMMNRISERISLKHTNSKFNKTVKRYNLNNESSMKDAIKDNFKLRDDLMRKIKSNAEGDEEYNSDEDEIEKTDSENGDGDIEDSEIDSNRLEDAENNENDDQSNNSDNNSDQKLILNFEDAPKTKEKKRESGVFGMKFMKNSEDIKSKLKSVLDDMSDDDEENESETGNKKANKLKFDKKEKKEIKKPEIKLKGKYNSRQKNTAVEDSDDEDNNKKSNNNNKPKNITSEVLNEVNDDAKNYIKQKNQIELNENDIKKIMDIEEIKNDDSNMYSNFFVKSDDNKKEFEDEVNAKAKEKSTVLEGWGNWTGESKNVQAKEFLRKKRYQAIMAKKTNNQTPKNQNFKISNVVDKKFNKFLVKELPHPFKSEAEFDKMNNNSVGSEWNSLDMYKKMIQPSIVKKIGQIIEPMKVNDQVSAKKLCEIIEKATKKKSRTKTKI